MKKSLGPQCLLFPTPVLLIGSYDQEQKPNLMTAAWGGICCSKPPCLAVSLREATYSFSAIVKRKAFTVGVPGKHQVKEADYIGTVSGRKVNKFAETGFTPVKSDLVDAPYADEVVFVLECTLLHTLEIGLHTLFVGEIIDAKSDTSVLKDDGSPDIMKIDPIIYDPAHQGYHGIGPFLGKAFSIGRK
ncbi:flavin reductase family protein [Desulforhopalus singaporensis]|uniref:NADH-FMN oxidoreductase RutF, flavin reductase (DIM6/NTAB) family n=1 Tax=Desulforhopalus singaporensis TaxID=91360 RepID=A0A1H0SSA6_9BACT|nr:flavin reductase family protein [Desulforhopalus singaporensis]SDP44631.1 NADH-FMN oxidoreductase RutF, flavin reductase (DIM6/NTAB) family [Desulforhopalus singaporensis]